MMQKLKNGKYVYLDIDLFPALAALDTIVEILHARLHIAIKYTIQRNLLTASHDDLITQLKQ